MKNSKAYKNIEDFIDDESFGQWVNREDPAAIEFWEEWIVSNPALIALVEEAEGIVRGIKFNTLMIGDHQENNALRALHEKIEKSQSDRSTTRILKMGKSNRIRFVAAAALLLLAVAFSTTWFNQNYGNVRYSTNYGEWKTIQLPDGSIVSLNANSQLEYSKNWEEEKFRTAKLKGEAFFDIVDIKNDGRAFQVITPDLDIEVIGTVFNVNTRDEKTEIFLREGNVKLDMGDHVTFMKEGDVLAFSSKTQSILNRHSSTGEDALSPDAWKNGVIIMNNASALEIFKKLEEVYGVNVHVESDSIYKRLYRIALPMERLDVVIPTLEMSMNVTIKHRGKTLFLE